MAKVTWEGAYQYEGWMIDPELGVSVGFVNHTRSILRSPAFAPVRDNWKEPFWPDVKGNCTSSCVQPSHRGMVSALFDISKRLATRSPLSCIVTCVKFTTAEAREVGTGSGAVPLTEIAVMTFAKSWRSTWIWIGAVRTSEGKGSAPPDSAGEEWGRRRYTYAVRLPASAQSSISRRA